MDHSDRFVEVIAAVSERAARTEVTGDSSETILISGTGSKQAWLPKRPGTMLSTAEHSGIIQYHPSELVVTARCGTRLKDLQLELAQHNQYLAAQPPMFNGAGTVGGAVSSGFSGPARPWGGSMRDAVLGVQMINGLGERLNFGGQVMKNVAGYDVARLVSGAFGSLGMILSASLRVQPVPQYESTVRFEKDPVEANRWVRELARSTLPLSASLWVDDQLYLRLSGSESALRSSLRHLGGETLDSTALWRDVRDHQFTFFKASAIDHPRSVQSRLWRLVVPPASIMPEVNAGDLCVEWAGGLRWLWHDDDEFVRRYASEVGGWCWQVGSLQPIDQVQAKLMRAIKNAFDPHHVFAAPFLTNLESADADEV